MSEDQKRPIVIDEGDLRRMTEDVALASELQALIDQLTMPWTVGLSRVGGLDEIGG